MSKINRPALERLEADIANIDDPTRRYLLERRIEKIKERYYPAEQREYYERRFAELLPKLEGFVPLDSEAVLDAIEGFLPTAADERATLRDLILLDTHAFVPFEDFTQFTSVGEADAYLTFLGERMAIYENPQLAFALIVSGVVSILDEATPTRGASPFQASYQVSRRAIREIYRIIRESSHYYVIFRALDRKVVENLRAFNNDESPIPLWFEGDEPVLEFDDRHIRDGELLHAYFRGTPLMELLS